MFYSFACFANNIKASKLEVIKKALVYMNFAVFNYWILSYKCWVGNLRHAAKLAHKVLSFFKIMHAQVPVGFSWSLWRVELMFTSYSFFSRRSPISSLPMQPKYWQAFGVFKMKLVALQVLRVEPPGMTSVSVDSKSSLYNGNYFSEAREAWPY